MKRGNYGKPFRPPPDGWSVPPKVFFGGLYQNLRPALNNLPKFVNNTAVQLQPGQIGGPYMRYDEGYTSSGCGATEYPNTNPLGPWLGLGPNQGVPFTLGGALNNTFQQSGTNSFGLNARQRGFKNVQAVRQWHGTLGWLSQDTANAQNSELCAIPICDCCGNAPNGVSFTCTEDPCSPAEGYAPTFDTTYSYSPYNAVPDQTKYLNITYDVALSGSSPDTSGNLTVTQSNGSGTVSINPFSGLRTQNLPTSEKITYTPYGGSPTVQVNINNGYDSIANLTGQSTTVDSWLAADFHDWYPPAMDGLDLFDFVMNNTNGWNWAQCGAAPAGESLPTLPAWTDPNNYSGTSVGSYVPTAFQGSPSPLTVHVSLGISFARTNTSLSWSFEWSISYTNIPTNAQNAYLPGSVNSSGTITLSNPNTPQAVYADVQTLLGTWNLADDAQYPWREDGVWQIAPLVSRDEVEQDVTPLGFNQFYVDDLRQPIADTSGNQPYTLNWTPTYARMPWFDPNAYQFGWPVGQDQTTAAATTFGQVACTGLICGMPMPSAFTDNRSLWFNPAAFSSSSSSSSSMDFENFFDFRAKVWSGCPAGAGAGCQILYLLGHGQWCYDMISASGALLPHSATQWTNFLDAATKTPYAYLAQGDQQLYGTNICGEAGQILANRADALWAQKCCEVLEIWPSQDFFRPAGYDRFAADETAVYCIDHWVGDTVYLTAPPTGIAAHGDLIGVSNNGNVGIFQASADIGFNSVTLTNQVYDLPTGFALPSGDTGNCIWKVRWPNAPAILGRDAVSQIVDNHDGTVTIVLANAEPNLMPGDAIDICSDTITYDGNGNKTGESMTVLVSAAVVLTPRIDDQHFKVIANYAALSSSFSSSSSSSLFITSHGAPNWYWDDNGRKGDFVALNWLHDYRTNGEVTRLNGTMDCTEAELYLYWGLGGGIGSRPANSNPPPAGTPNTNNGYQAAPPLPAVCSPYNSLAWSGDNFQAQGAAVFKPCCPAIIAITPNGETFNNGVVIPFPATFAFDDLYGARWQCEIEQAMTDLLYQTPHTPCTQGNGGNDFTSWEQDNGNYCNQNDQPPGTQWYAFPPQVEARINLPANGGPNANELAPALPAGIVIGYLNPVTNSGGLPPPGYQQWATDLTPSGVFTFWAFRQDIENGACFNSCQFNYIDQENLPCVISYTPPAQPGGSGLSGLPGIS